MANSVTKLPNDFGQNNQDGSRTSRGDSGQTAAMKVSAGQGREIFTQVNVSFGVNPRSSDVDRGKKKSDSGNENSEDQKTGLKEIKQGADSAKIKKNQGTDSSKTPENPADKGAKPDNPQNRERGGFERYNPNSTEVSDNQNFEENSPNSQNPKRNSPDIRNAVNTAKDAAENATLFSSGNYRSSSNSTDKNAPQTRQFNLLSNIPPDNNPKIGSNPRDVRTNGLLGEVINQIFRENDVYLSEDAVRNLVERRGADVSNRSSNPAFDHLPKELSRLVQTIENQILRTTDGREIDHKNNFNSVNIEIPRELDNQIKSAGNLLTQIFGTNEAKKFSQLDVRERMLAAIESLVRNLPPELSENLKNHFPEQILQGFLLARGLINSKNADSNNNASPENLLEMMRLGASDKTSLATLRDLGGLVKVLISDAAAAKSTSNLENAVQKFARILIAVNCLETVLTAVKLANQNQFAGGNVGRTLAIVQVYELINRLILSGEKALKEAAEAALENAAKNEPNKQMRGSVLPIGTIEDLSETDETNKFDNSGKKMTDAKIAAAENARRFLEFNPMFANDRFVSAFDNSDNFRQAQNAFLDRHQIEIEQWLRGGNHRFVKDIEFEKPIGIVVERGASDFLTAAAARIVLVRDGSIQGWHFLKSTLVT